MYFTALSIKLSITILKAFLSNTILAEEFPWINMLSEESWICPADSNTSDLIIYQAIGGIYTNKWVGCAVVSNQQITYYYKKYNSYRLHLAYNTHFIILKILLFDFYF